MSSVTNYQRAYTFSKNLNYGVDEWYLTPKYDGIRCWYDSETEKLYFRSGREVIRMNHILNACKEISDRHSLKMVDGELYVPGLKFREISSLVNAQKSITDEQKQTVKLVVFAVRRKPTFEWTTEWTTPAMIDVLKAINYPENVLLPVEYELIQNDWDVIEKRVREMQSLGWEGGILRNPNISYIEGGTRTLLKLKFPNEADFKIIDFTEGTKSYSGTLGALWVEGMALDEDRNEILVRSKVSSGLSRDLRREIWGDRSTYLGVGVRLTYQKATPVDEDGYGSLRFPRFQHLMQNCEFIKL